VKSDPLNIPHDMDKLNTPSNDGMVTSCPHVNMIADDTSTDDVGGEKFGLSKKNYKF